MFRLLSGRRAEIGDGFGQQRLRTWLSVSGESRPDRRHSIAGGVVCEWASLRMTPSVAPVSFVHSLLVGLRAADAFEAS